MNFSSVAKLHKRVGNCSGIFVNLMSGGAVSPCHSYSANPLNNTQWCGRKACTVIKLHGGLHCRAGMKRVNTAWTNTYVLLWLSVHFVYSIMQFSPFFVEPICTATRGQRFDHRVKGQTVT